MKKQFAIIFTSFICAINMGAQIYTPGGSIQGQSGNNNVGIGVKNPIDAKLQLKGDYNLRIDPSQGPIPYFYITSNAANNVIGTNIRTKVGTWDVLDYSLPSAYIDFDTNSSNNPTYGGIKFLTRTAGSQSNLGVARMTIKNNGNIGIGTRNPENAKLHIEGDYNIRIEPSNGTKSHFYITTNSSDNIIGTNIRTKVGTWEVPEKSKPSAYIDFSTYNNNSANGGIFFSTRSAGEQSNIGIARMAIKSDGKVGIGTKNPEYDLDVLGVIRAREIKVDLEGADFVFEKEYKLMSLIELEKFILDKKHLPEIAPAKEMEKNGANIGALNTKLLQKIEELTLYTIEQNKQLEKQDDAIEELKKILEKQSKEIAKLKSAIK